MKLIYRGGDPISAGEQLRTELGELPPGQKAVDHRGRIKRRGGAVSAVQRRSGI